MLLKINNICLFNYFNNYYINFSMFTSFYFKLRLICEQNYNFKKF